MNQIEQAVAPLKADCVARTVEFTRDYLTKFATRLVGTDLNLLQPHTKMKRSDYIQAKERSGLASRVCETANVPYRNRFEPNMAVAVNQEAIEWLVEDAAKDAALSFDSYVRKLTQKVGECDTATVVGNLWMGSTLTVTKGDVTERWNTKIIVNVSCLGKVFNQFPTRLKK